MKFLQSLFTLFLISNICFFNSLSAQIIYVNDDATGNNDGSSWADAYTDLQDAIDAQSNEDIWVAAGTYTPSKDAGGSIPSNPWDATFALYNEVSIYGGFAGTETALSQRDIANNPSILDGDHGVSVNSFYIVWIEYPSGPVTIDGFSVTNASESAIYIYGGSTHIIRNNTIHDNNGDIGAGLAIWDGAECQIIGNTFYNNVGANGGAVMLQSSEYQLFIDNIFYNNTGLSSGAVFYAFDHDLLVVFIRNIFYNNVGDYTIDTESFSGSYSFYRCIFYNEEIDGAGSVDITHSTCINTNILVGNGSVNRSVFYSSTLPAWLSATGCDAETAHVSLVNVNIGTNNLIFMNYNSSTYNITDQGARFVDINDPDGPDDVWGTADDGLMLKSCSPGIGYCSPDTYWLNTDDKDITGTVITSTNWDIGAYQNPNPTVVSDRSELTTVAATSTLMMGDSTYFGTDCSGLIAGVKQAGTNPVTGSVAAQVWMDASPQQHQGSLYVPRHYEITPATNPNTATGKVTLYYTQADFDAFNMDPMSVTDLPTDETDATGIANLRISKFSGVSSDGTGSPASYSGTLEEIDPADSDIIWDDCKMRWEVSFEVTGFSGFFAHSASEVLPVEMMYFNAEKEEKTALLTWATASEENNAGFIIERSTDGYEFEEIGFVEGMGNTAEVQEYRFTDDFPMDGINYYRLTQVDFDGTTSVSETRQLNFGTDKDINLSLYPNPANGKNKVSLDLESDYEGSISIQITSIDGQQTSIKQENAVKGMNSFSLDLSSLASGIYIVNVSLGNEHHQIKLVK